MSLTHSTGALVNAGRIRRALIVAPLSILGVWEEEFQKFAAFPYALAVLTGPGAKKLDTLRHMTGTVLQVVVVNYESAWRLEKDLLAWPPDLIVADEGHKIKAHNIAASKAECLDLPETTNVLRQVELEPAALRIYKGLVKESYAELADGGQDAPAVTATNILTRLLRLSQLTGGFIGSDENAAVEQVSAAKLSALEDILDATLAEGKKLVLYPGDQGDL